MSTSASEQEFSVILPVLLFAVCSYPRVINVLLSRMPLPLCAQRVCQLSKQGAQMLMTSSASALGGSRRTYCAGSGRARALSRDQRRLVARRQGERVSHNECTRRWAAVAKRASRRVRARHSTEARLARVAPVEGRAESLARQMSSDGDKVPLDAPMLVARTPAKIARRGGSS